MSSPISGVTASTVVGCIVIGGTLTASIATITAGGTFANGRCCGRTQFRIDRVRNHRMSLIMAVATDDAVRFGRTKATGHTTTSTATILTKTSIADHFAIIKLLAMFALSCGDVRRSG